MRERTVNLFDINDKAGDEAKHCGKEARVTVAHEKRNRVRKLKNIPDIKIAYIAILDKKTCLSKLLIINC